MLFSEMLGPFFQYEGKIDWVAHFKRARAHNHAYICVCLYVQTHVHTHPPTFCFLMLPRRTYVLLISPLVNVIKRSSQ